jgi:effector-binding domain-containing protein
MTNEVLVEMAAARPMAAVRRRVQVGEIGAAWRPALDLVWAFLRRNEGLRTDGHNIFLYRHPAQPGDPMEVDFGVEVSRAFEGEGEVIATSTPAGQVASTLHLGRIERIGEAHRAIDAWGTSHGREFGGWSWEIYGDPGDDPDRFEVQVVYQLA